MLDSNVIQEIFKNSYTEINKNHNEAIDVFRRYKEKSGKCPNILVHFDTHSDAYINSGLDFCNIATWVNYAVSEFNIKEFYWVIPNYIFNNEKYKKIYEQKQFLTANDCMHGFDSRTCDFNVVNKEEFLVNEKTKEIISPRRITFINENCDKFGLQSIFDFDLGFRNLTVYILTAKNLSVLADKEFLLSIDADYFCNSGFDTIENIHNSDIGKEELLGEFKIFIQQLKEAQIKPICTSLTLSPTYLPLKFSNEIESFYSTIKAASLS